MGGGGLQTVNCKPQTCLIVLHYFKNANCSIGSSNTSGISSGAIANNINNTTAGMTCIIKSSSVLNRKSKYLLYLETSCLLLLQNNDFLTRHCILNSMNCAMNVTPAAKIASNKGYLKIMKIKTRITIAIENVYLRLMSFVIPIAGSPSAVASMQGAAICCGKNKISIVAPVVNQRYDATRPLSKDLNPVKIVPFCNRVISILIGTTINNTTKNHQAGTPTIVSGNK